MSKMRPRNGAGEKDTASANDMRTYCCDREVSFAKSGYDQLIPLGTDTDKDFAPTERGTLVLHILNWLDKKTGPWKIGITILPAPDETRHSRILPPNPG